MGEMVYVKACRRSRWHLALESKSGKFPGVKRVPFKCRSWRHEGECREWCGHCDYVRCEHALKKFTHWSFLVLTYRKQAWPDVRELFRSSVKHFYALRKRLVKVIGKFKYIQTWEITRKGTPHVNVAISSRKLLEWIEDEGVWVPDAKRKLRMRWQWHDLGKCFKTAILEPAQVASGFGSVSTLEPMTDPELMGGYMVKLARELTGAGTKSQVPVNAPPHWRRIRASQHTLPPRVKDPDLTGTLEFSYHPEYAQGKWVALDNRAIASRHCSHVDYSSGVAQLVHS